MIVLVRCLCSVELRLCFPILVPLSSSLVRVLQNNNKNKKKKKEETAKCGLIKEIVLT